MGFDAAAGSGQGPTDVVRWLFAACGQWLLQESRRRTPPSGDKPAGCLTLTVSGQLDRTLLAEMAYFHNLEPILHDLVRKRILSTRGIPEDLTRRWEAAYYGTVVANTESLQLLFRFCAASRTRDLPLMVLKGPASIARIYRDTGLRTMADLDVLCGDAVLAECGRVARSVGFNHPGDIYVHHVTLFHDRLGIPLELHFGLYHWLTHQEHLLGEMWKHRQWLDLEGVQIPAMATEDQLVFDLAHIVSHHYRVPLKHYLDLMGLLVLFRSQIDLARVFRLLSLGTLREDFLALCGSLSDLLAVPLDVGPGRADEKTQDRFTRKVVDYAASEGFVGWKEAGGELRRQAGLVQKTRFVMRRLIPPVAALQVRYDLSSRQRARWMRPNHVLATLNDLRRRKNRESKADRTSVLSSGPEEHRLP